MSVVKKALLIGLGISTFNAVICMEDTIKEIKQPMLDILYYARKADHDPMYMDMLANWLAQRRYDTPDTKEWGNLIYWLAQETIKQDKLIEELRGEHCTGASSSCVTKEIIKIVADVAHNLEPNKMCSETLVKRTQEFMEKRNQRLKDGPY